MTELPERYRDAVQFAFGDTPALKDALLALVLSGKKTATCTALRDIKDAHEPMPKVGRRDVVLDGAGKPAAVIETTEVDICRFDEVGEDFARDEGEGDLSLEHWRESHETYFARNGGFSPDMELVCERFRLVETLQDDEQETGS
ncbi:ASCH domain-containing protein [Martelella limonii]|uniref:ASCH domain-containing protein n=1 Tax=Martelella limonii TaxID=1647649 RepID=UPI001580E7F2|nr:ASCH domain-containing protein [Martelella limonii]